ncbi:MAG: plasmid stabilization protein [Meiothermus sp.]
MSRGDKSAYTGKQKRQAEHIEKSYEDRGVSKDRAEQIAWATVNKQDGGGKRSGSGRGHSSDNKSGQGSSSARSEAAKKGWDTRRRNAKSK